MNQTTPSVVKLSMEDLITKAPVDEDKCVMYASDENNAGAQLHFTTEQAAPDHDESHLTIAKVRRKRLLRILVHITIGALFTSWWIAGFVLHRQDKSWVVPFLLWLAVILRLLLWHVSATHLTKPLAGLSGRVSGIYRLATARVNSKWSAISSAILLVAMISTITFLTEEGDEYNNAVNRSISLAGIALTIGLLWLTSRNRKKVCWHSIIVGLYLQFLIALFVLRTEVGYNIFSFLSDRATDFLDFALDGLAFLTDTSVTSLSWFIISVVPPIIFFAGSAQLLSYWGILQWLVRKAATFFFWALKVSGAEAVTAASAPFFGQGESVMLIKPFLTSVTMAEMHQIMSSGFATIAGSVLLAYIALGVNGQALISSCIMSIPASIVVSKLRYPETEETLTAKTLSVTSVKDARDDAANWIHAFTNGCWLGVKLAAIVVAVLASVVALVSGCDAFLTWFGSYLNIEDLTLELILGYALVPVTFFLGVPRNEQMVLVGRLIATKILKNEFQAYELLTSGTEYIGLPPRSRLIATYSLCGFGNIGALGTQVGLMSQLAPSRAKDIADVAVSALFSGIVATITSASMAGLLLSDQAAAQMLPPPNGPLHCTKAAGCNISS